MRYFYFLLILLISSIIEATPPEPLTGRFANWARTRQVTKAVKRMGSTFHQIDQALHVHLFSKDQHRHTRVLEAVATLPSQERVERISIILRYIQKAKEDSLYRSFNALFPKFTKALLNVSMDRQKVILEALPENFDATLFVPFCEKIVAFNFDRDPQRLKYLCAAPILSETIESLGHTIYGIHSDKLETLMRKAYENPPSNNAAFVQALKALIPVRDNCEYFDCSYARGIDSHLKPIFDEVGKHFTSAIPLSDIKIKEKVQTHLARLLLKVRYKDVSSVLQILSQSLRDFDGAELLSFLQILDDHIHVFHGEKDLRGFFSLSDLHKKGILREALKWDQCLKVEGGLSPWQDWQKLILTVLSEYELSRANTIVKVVARLTCPNEKGYMAEPSRVLDLVKKLKDLDPLPEKTGLILLDISPRDLNTAINDPIEFVRGVNKNIWKTNNPHWFSEV